MLFGVMGVGMTGAGEVQNWVDPVGEKPPRGGVRDGGVTVTPGKNVRSGISADGRPIGND